MAWLSYNMVCEVLLLSAITQQFVIPLNEQEVVKDPKILLLDQQILSDSDSNDFLITPASAAAIPTL
jgi:hypothetical protein